MNRDRWIVLSLAYIAGLFATGLFYFSGRDLFSFTGIQIGLLIALIVTIAKVVTEDYIDNRTWIIAFVLALVAVFYFQLRVPQPQKNDISKLIEPGDFQEITVVGRVLTEPRLNSSGKLKFWLQAIEFAPQKTDDYRKIAGKLYVTIPLVEGHKTYPKQLITISGALYKPTPPKDKTQFNFARYLRTSGTFAGLTAWEISDRSKPKWGWYQLRRQIVRTQVKGLGSPLGQLMSSIVLGRKAVDLPEDIRNLFIKGGLAHLLAASGFHVSLLLGAILKLTKSLGRKKKLVFGTAILIFYDCLSGFSPSVIRATIMGLAVLVATAINAKIRPLGMLLFAALVILLFNPLLIWNLSFQLSFLATLGLIITLPYLEAKLDWLPTSIAIVIAIPLAASVWTLPLIAYVFHSLPTYSILTNIVTAPLVGLISLSGMFFSAIALISPTFSSYGAWLLKYPLLWLISIVRFFSDLPGNTFAIGTFGLWSLLLVYALLISIWLNHNLRKKWWLVVLLILLLIIAPIRYKQTTQLQVTIFDSQKQPTIVIQDRSQVILLDNADIETLKYQILPFLSSQGINRIDYYLLGLQTTSNYIENLAKITSQLSVNNLIAYDFLQTNRAKSFNRLSSTYTIPLESNSTINTDSIRIQPTSNNTALQLRIKQDKYNRKWLLTNNNLLPVIQNSPDTVIWLGKPLDIKILNEINSQFAIAKAVAPMTQNNAIAFSSEKTNSTTTIYTTEERGTITWTPQTQFVTAAEIAKRNNIFW